MTSIIGIRTNLGSDGIVVASDRNIGEYDEKDTVIKLNLRKKIHFGDYWVMSHTGIITKSLSKFYGVLKGHKSCGSDDERAREIFENAVKNKYFREVNELNTAVMRNEEDINSTLEFLLAVRLSKFGLWKVDAFGNLRASADDSDFDYICMGSGSEFMESYINERISDGKIVSDGVKISSAVKIANDVMGSSEQDPGSGFGYDLAVLTKDGVRELGSGIRKAQMEGGLAKLTEIRQHYDSLENEKD